MQTLSVEDVLGIYDILAEDFARSNDPISPAGVRSRNLLESAVSRQFTGYGGFVKYPHPLKNAASFTYGICCDHAFHNGNKRTALVAMLVHLDRNEYALTGVSQDELYSVMIAIADHRLGLRADPRRPDKVLKWANSDEEVESIYDFLRRHAQRIERGERVIAYRQLRRILTRFGVQMESCGPNHVELLRYVERERGLVRRVRTRERQLIGKIGYRDEGTDLTKSELKRIRELCNLTEEDGVDSAAFYAFGEVVDSFVNRYRRTLTRLARR